MWRSLIGIGIGIVHYFLGYLGRNHLAGRSSCSTLIDNHLDSDTDTDTDADTERGILRHSTESRDP